MKAKAECKKTRPVPDYRIDMDLSVDDTIRHIACSISGRGTTTNPRGNIMVGDIRFEGVFPSHHAHISALKGIRLTACRFTNASKVVSVRPDLVVSIENGKKAYAYLVALLPSLIKREEEIVVKQKAQEDVDAERRQKGVTLGILIQPKGYVNFDRWSNTYSVSYSGEYAVVEKIVKAIAAIIKPAELSADDILAAVKTI